MTSLRNGQAIPFRLFHRVAHHALNNMIGMRTHVFVRLLWVRSPDLAKHTGDRSSAMWLYWIAVFHIALRIYRRVSVVLHLDQQMK
jgi:hypothetical protein